MNWKIAAIAAASVIAGIVLFALMRSPEPISAERYVKPDELFQKVESNVSGDPRFEVIVDIDHSRLAAKAGSIMPPAHVLIWSDSELESAMVQENPLVALDLPMRVLAYEDPETGDAGVISNSFDFVAQRHSLTEDLEQRARYESAIEAAMDKIPAASIRNFSSDTMEGSGIISLSSPFSFEVTEERVMDAIKSQGDTVIFGTVDFAERAKQHEVKMPQLKLVLFGGPGPGGKAMASAPSLGLDAFCQKLVICEDEDGKVQVAFNDLLALAERQGVPIGIPLRVINRRLKSTFTTALEE